MVLKPVKRVAIAIESTGSGWLGGLNYFRNLLFAVQSLPEAQIRMVLVTGNHVDVSQFGSDILVIRSPVLDINSIPYLIRKVVKKLFKRDVLLYILLRKHNVDFLSHSDFLWRGSKIPAMPWIPDFQVFHMPELYNSGHVKKLEKTFGNYVKYGDCVLLSSESARKDLHDFFGDVLKPESKVLRFSSTLMRNVNWVDKDEIVSRYKLDRPWFHLPNQFWAHKNHMIVLEALKIAKEKGADPLVIATGNTEDNRNPEYISNIKRTIKQYGLENNFRMPGIIPYEDMLTLMRYAIAVINPSKFEGWSTSVEEARSLGKQTILSDISVHKEQSPPRCIFFKKDSAMELSGLIEKLEAGFDAELEGQVYKDAMNQLQIRQTDFAKRYEKIILELAS